MNNLGWIKEPIEINEWIAGANSPIEKEVINEEGDWRKYVPEFEKQRFGSTETMACVSYSALNCVEMLLRQKNKRVNFSDRFLAKKSNTTHRGNTAEAVAETLRLYGVCSEEMWSVPRGTFYWDDYYKKPSNEAKLEAWNNKEKYKFNHEWVSNEYLTDALRYGPVQIFINANYVYSKKDHCYINSGHPINHAVVLLAIVDGYYFIYDTYEPFIKKLAPDYRKNRFAKIFFINPNFMGKLTEKIIYKYADGGTMRIGFVLDEQLYISTEKCTEIKVLIEAVARGCDINSIKTISASMWNSLPHCNLKGERVAY